MRDNRIEQSGATQDEKDIEDAIEKGEQIERDGEIITPIDSETAIVEDKESGEFSKAIMDDDTLDIEPISEDEADELTKDVAVEDHDNDEEDKKFSCATGDYYYQYGNAPLDKFFAQVMGDPNAMAAQGNPSAGSMNPAAAGPMNPVNPNAMPPAVDEYGNPVDPNAMGAEEPAPSIESIEDKAVAAVQSIQAAAAEAEATIMNAKAAPMQQVEPDLQEAQFSYYDDDEDVRYFSETEEHPQSTLLSWITYGQNFN